MSSYRQPKHLLKLPQHQRNYVLQRENDFRAPTLTRPAEFKWLKLPRPIVLINGAFDLLHSGHMRLIFAARHKAATLVAALDSDSKVRRNKGHGRPYLDFAERCTALGFMPINFISEIDSDKDMDVLMKCLNPDLRVLGDEYRLAEGRYPSVPRLLVRTGAIHTTALAGRIVDAYKKQQDADA